MAANYFPDLERETARILAERHWTLRQAEIRTGVSYSVIHNMRHGRRPTVQVLVQWAVGVGEDPRSWAKAAGFGEIADGLMPDEGPVTAPDRPELRAIGERIKAVRLSRNMSQVDFGRLVGVERATVANWENGRREIGVTDLERLGTNILDKPANR